MDTLHRNSFIKSTIIVILYFIIVKKKRTIKGSYSEVTISIMSCNRIEYLNRTIKRIYNHIIYYEKYIFVTYIHFDQGTPGIDGVIIQTKDNIFYCNPSGYSFSFTLLFSYLYTEYVILLEEDWLVIKNIEKIIKHSNFIYTSMKLLSNTNLIYGLYLRQHPKGYSIKRFDRNLNITYYEVIKPWSGFCFTNGASIYKSKNIKRMNYKSSEYQTARTCMKLKYHIGYAIWRYKNSNGGIEYPFEHIGLKSTKTGVCNISTY